MAIKKVTMFIDEETGRAYNSIDEINSFIGKDEDNSIYIGCFDYASGNFMVFVADPEGIYIETIVATHENGDLITLSELEVALNDLFETRIDIVQIFTDYSALKGMPSAS